MQTMEIDFYDLCCEKLPLTKKNIMHPTSAAITETMPEDQDMTASVEPADAEGSSYNACIPLPDDMASSMNEGDAFDGTITGTVITKDGKLSVEVETMNGEPIESNQSPEEEGLEAESYTGKSETDMEMNGPEALDKFMKSRKVTQ